jgi:hypothetical protein
LIRNYTPDSGDEASGKGSIRESQKKTTLTNTLKSNINKHKYYSVQDISSQSIRNYSQINLFNLSNPLNIVYNCKDGSQIDSKSKCHKVLQIYLIVRFRLPNLHAEALRGGHFLT